MELKDFVAQSLSQIAEGVLEAQAQLAKTEARVNPALDQFLPKGERNYEGFALSKKGRKPIFLVTFDVAVTASEGSKTKGGIGVVTGLFAMGSAGESDKGNANVSRIGFQVPLLFPTQPD